MQVLDQIANCLYIYVIGTTGFQIKEGKTMATKSMIIQDTILAVLKQANLDAQTRTYIADSLYKMVEAVKAGN